MVRSTTLAVGLVLMATGGALCGEAAGEGTGEGSLDMLIERVETSEPGEQVDAIRAIAEMGEEGAEAVPILLKQLDAEDFETRGAAAEALAAIGAEGDEVVAALIEHFTGDGYVIKAEPQRHVVPLFAVYGLSAGAFGEEAVEPLTEALKSDTQQVYLAASIGLEAIGPAGVKAMPNLIAMLESEDGRKRAAAAGAIRGIGPGAVDAVPALIKMLYDENFHYQYWACRALGAIGPGAAGATNDLLDRLEKGAVSVRRNAAMALGNIGPEIGADAAGQLIRTVEGEPLAPVREEAVIALGKLKPFADDSVPALKKALSNPSFTSPTHAARALWLLTDDATEAIPLLVKSLDDLTYFQHATEVLGEMGSEASPAVDRLAKALGERDPDDRVAAVYALARIGTPTDKITDAIRPALEDDSDQVREAARIALKELESGEVEQ